MIQYLALILFVCVYSSVIAQEKPKQPAVNTQELADKLANPVANMVSIPFQNNSDWGIGEYNGSKNTLNFQPVLPLTLNNNLNLITRMVLPIIDQRDVTGPDTHQFGLADATLSAFFSPSGSKNGLIWGAGPAFLVPTATNDFLATKKFGVGPTALVLRQNHGTTFGVLLNQLWSVAGNKNRSDVSQLFVQPFFAHSFPTGASLGGNFELTQNWEANTTLLFFNPTVSGLTKLGKLPIQLVVGPRIPLGPDNSKPKFGIRSVLIFVFPK